MLTFAEALKDGTPLVISQNTKHESKGVYIDARVDINTVPEGWYAYDIRHGDNVYFASLEPHVIVNHAGTFLTTKEVRLNQHNAHCLCHGAGYTFL